MSFPLVPKSMNLNDLERRNGSYVRYFAEFGREQYVKCLCLGDVLCHIYRERIC